MAKWMRTFGAGVPAGEGPGRKPDAPGGHQARSEVGFGLGAESLRRGPQAGGRRSAVGGEWQ